MIDRVAQCTGDLGRAPQRVGVLHALIVFAVRRRDPRAGEQRDEVRRAHRLARVGSQGVEELGKVCLVGPEERLDAHRRGDVGRGRERAQVCEGEHEHAQHPVGPVDEGEPLLRLESQRCNPGRLE